jgi:hypothetical protein
MATQQRTFDPKQVAYYETAGWQAYYDRRWLRVLQLMVELNHVQFGMPWPTALSAALDTVRASIAFAPLDNNIPAAQRAIERFYTKARHSVGMAADATTLAALEIDYWVVHRRLARQRMTDPSARDITPMVDSLARLHAVLFNSTPERMRLSAQLRALAAVTVDEITARRSTDIAADWRAIEQYLNLAYRAVLVMRDR